ncbi:MAG: VWA domain-containing protein [Pirellulales bacterium]|nr:VWA domain-containing protein [Pirellulales bacterium]
MTFEHPTLLLLLWLLPPAAALLIYAHRKRAAAARHFIEPGMQTRLMPPQRPGRLWLKGGLLLLGLALVIVAAARPRFGAYYEKVRQRGVDCFVCLDVSRSMLAEDVAPSRLKRAKFDVLDLLAKLHGDRAGLIVFAGKPVVKVPLTADEGFFRMVLDQVDATSAPRGGTCIGDAIRKALESLPPRGDHDQIIVLITDGEDQESFPEEAARSAKDRGVKIFTVGLGDAGEGARIPVRDGRGQLAYLKYHGNEHWSKVNSDLLEKIALTTGGAYIPAGTRNYELGQFYEKNLAGLTRGQQAVKQQRKRYHEQYQLFLGLGMLLLAGERLIPRCARLNGRRREET